MNPWLAFGLGAFVGVGAVVGLLIWFLKGCGLSEVYRR